MYFPRMHIVASGVFESKPEKITTVTRLICNYVLECYISNTGKTCINGQWYDLQRSSISLSRPGQFRCSELPFETRFIYFEAGEENETFNNLLQSLPSWLPPQQRYVELFDKILSHSDDELRASTLLIELLYTMKHYTSDAKPDIIHQGQHEIIASIEFMKNNLHRKLSTEEMANASGYSIPHFTHLFHKYVNTSPYNYFIELKLNKAEQMLLSGIRISTICEKLGIESTSHFCAIFKSKRGMTPREFIKDQKDHIDTDFLL